MRGKFPVAGVIVALLTMTSAVQAMAQCGPQCQAVCQGGSGGGCPGGGGGGGGRGNGRSSAEIQAVQQYNQAVDVYNRGIDAMRAGRYSEAEDDIRQALAIQPDLPNAATSLLLNQGFEAFSKGDYATALSDYQQILQIDPGDRGAPVHIAKARAAIAMTNGFAAWNRGDLQTALVFYKQAYGLDSFKGYLDSINVLQDRLQQAAIQRRTSQAVSDLADTVANAQNSRRAVASGLDFKPGGDPAAGKGPTTTAGAFGDPVARPRLAAPGPIADRDGTDTRAGDQALAAARDGAAGGDLTPNYDVGRVQSAGPLAVAPQGIGQTPSTADLVAHIGAGMQNQGIRNSVAYYQKLDGLKIDAQVQLAAVQQQLDHGGGDALALNQHKAALVGQITDYQVQQTTTQAQIKEQMTAINIPWTVSPAPSPSTATAQTSAAKP